MVHKSANRPTGAGREPAPVTGPARLAARRGARREKILDAAMEIVEREGFAGLTLVRLAAGLGQSIGALYRTFPGKAGLLVALQLRAISSLQAEVTLAQREAAHRTHGSPGARPHKRVVALSLVLSSLRPFIDNHRLSPARYALLDGLLSSPEAVLDTAELRLVNGALEPLLGAVAQGLEAAAEHGALEPGDAALRTRILWAALHGLDHLRKRDRGEPKQLRSPALVRGTLLSLLRGFGADPRELDAALALALP
jgi:AcrR family transcriptional regulator